MPLSVPSHSFYRYLFVGGSRDRRGGGSIVHVKACGERDVKVWSCPEIRQQLESFTSESKTFVLAGVS